MGYIILGQTIFGDPEEGSTIAVSKDLAICCDLCNAPAPFYIASSYWVCPICHAVT